jgi:hypothetical protein
VPSALRKEEIQEVIHANTASEQPNINDSGVFTDPAKHHYDHTSPLPAGSPWMLHGIAQTARAFDQLGTLMAM